MRITIRQGCATSKSAPASGSDTHLHFALCPCSLTPTTTSSMLDFPAALFAVGGILWGVEGRHTQSCPINIISKRSSRVRPPAYIHALVFTATLNIRPDGHIEEVDCA
ncbi:hypothetical protein L208DRAFT_1394459 [Tricholoma matsutake]|nr:hypothetical protein L208DRAFT_1394459 [Tricholoma matsutake 945]